MPCTTTEKRDAAARLGRAARAMLDPAVVAGPDPGVDALRAVRRSAAPCLRCNRGEDASSLLAARYRARPPDELEEGRLGGASWGMGRGAAPPRLRTRR